MKWLTKWLSKTVKVPVILLVLVLVMGGGSLLASGLQNQAFQAGQRHQQAEQHAAQVHEQAAQRKQGEMIERKICQDVGTMAAIMPPAGPAATNPSRAYEQAEHRAWSGLVVAVGCK